VADGSIGTGGAIDASEPGWHELLDRTGMPAAAGSAVFECRWHIAPSPSPGALLIAVRVIPVGRAAEAVTIATVVPGG